MSLNGFDYLSDNMHSMDYAAARCPPRLFVMLWHCGKTAKSIVEICCLVSHHSSFLTIKPCSEIPTALPSTGMQSKSEI